MTQHSGTTVLGALLSAGESLIGEAESAITTRNQINKYTNTHKYTHLNFVFHFPFFGRRPWAEGR